MTEIRNSPEALSHSYEIMQTKLGAKGMAMLDDQLTVWRDLSDREITNPLKDRFRNGDTTLPEGTLLHGMGLHSFNGDALRSIAEKGIVSGELIGVMEDSETHGCADFFRVPQETDIASYLIDAKTPIMTGRIRSQKSERLLTSGVTFIVDPNAEGMDKLLQHDGYRNSEMSDFISTPRGRTADNTAAILGGVPKGAVAGIVLSDRLLEQSGVSALVHELFPDTPVFDQRANTQLEHNAA